MRKQTFNLLVVSLSIGLITACKNGGSAPGAVAIGNDYELVYGSSTGDRSALTARINGSTAPQLADVLTRWRRFSGTEYYPTLTSIVATPSYCQTTMQANGSWTNSVSPVANPNTDAACNTPTMNSLSWVLLSGPERIHNIQNTNNYNGFFSSLKFDTFIAEATLSSTNADNDALGMTIAVYVDGLGLIQTLSAYRTHGGLPPTAGWGLIHKTGNTINRIIDEKSVGTNSSGWNNTNTKIRIERTGNIVKAYASRWAAGLTASAIDSSSLIQVDLSDPAQNLTGFMGAQSYGYETKSQPNATFGDLAFSVPGTNSDPDYIYDLHNNLVYQKKSAGGYEVVAGAKAMEQLGYPKTITNVETQRQFTINSATSFTESGD